MASEQQLVSFVLRFVCDPPANAAIEGTGVQNLSPGTLARGMVRHIQSDAEQHFTCWEDAVTFIEKFVLLEANKKGDAANE